MKIGYAREVRFGIDIDIKRELLFHEGYLRFTQIPKTVEMNTAK